MFGPCSNDCSNCNHTMLDVEYCPKSDYVITSKTLEELEMRKIERERHINNTYNNLVGGYKKLEAQTLVDYRKMLNYLNLLEQDYNETKSRLESELFD